MNENRIPEDLKQEYLEFSSSTESDAPPSSAATVRTQIRERMTPSPFLVFLKLTAIVCVVGVMNLTLCPQFGLGFARHSGLMEYFMSFGSQGCRIACGAFFIGSGLFLASLIFYPEDILVARKSVFLQASALGAISLTAFVACGGDVYFEAALFWLLGCLVGGGVALELGFMVKRRLILSGIA